MNLGEYRSFNEGYARIIDNVEVHGDRFRPRGHSCLEVRPGHFQIYSCNLGLYSGVSRKLNYRFLAAEALSYIAGWCHTEHAELLCMLNPKVLPFVNAKTAMFDGAYGQSFARSLPLVAQSLIDDPHTRQAYASIWKPDPLGMMPTKDLPCTLGLHFYSLPGKNVWGDVINAQDSHIVSRLGMSAHMRSNDLNWGTPYDVAAFCAIQLSMCSVTAMDPGPYHHHAGSIHVYEETPPNVHTPDSEGFLDFPQSCLPYDESSHYLGNWSKLVDDARLWLEELHHHIVTQEAPHTDFVSSLECVGEELNDGTDPPHPAYYWRHWGDLVRFSWKKYL